MSAHPSLVTADAAVRTTFEAMRAAGRAKGAPSYAERLDRLSRLLDLVRTYEARFVEAVSADFGQRSKHETLMAEVFPIVSHIKLAQRKLKSWMAPHPVGTAWLFFPAKNRVVYEPLGVVGIIAPWNYPLHLSLIPLAEALAAGNRVMLKPSELTPATAEVIRELVDAGFEDDEVSVVIGDVEVAQAFTRLPFDHLFFTGSTTVGRHVMRAAAENLTPVTLELGGKSPALVHPDYDHAHAAERVCFGKLLNAGQTCVAPDYAMIHASKVDAFVEAFKSAAQTMYGHFESNRDYSAIISDRHRERLLRLVDEAKHAGARVVTLGDPAIEAEERSDGSRKLVPHLVIGAPDHVALMREEIFGPVLPVVAYTELKDAIAYINDRDKPLAFYYFDDDSRRVDDVRRRTSSGGMAVNETLLHLAQDELAFGGVGASGMGRYHGFDGFKTFSNARAVYYQSKLAQTHRFNPPYRTFVDKMLRRLIG